MKFELAVSIGKSLFYITFPIIFLFASVFCLIKLNPLTILLGVFFLAMVFITPILSKELLFKYCDEIIQEAKKIE